MILRNYDCYPPSPPTKGYPEVTNILYVMTHLNLTLRRRQSSLLLGDISLSELTLWGSQFKYILKKAVTKLTPHLPRALRVPPTSPASGP